jgi:threonine aldolase
VDPAEVETNLVKVQVPPNAPPASEWSAQLEREGIRVSPCEAYALRFVTHRHIGKAEVDETVRAFSSVFARLRAS